MEQTVSWKPPTIPATCAITITTQPGIWRWSPIRQKCCTVSGTNLFLFERGYDPYLMTQIEDGNGSVLLRNEFADHSRVSAQKLANGQVVIYTTAITILLKPRSRSRMASNSASFSRKGNQ